MVGGYRRHRAAGRSLRRGRGTFLSSFLSSCACEGGDPKGECPAPGCSDRQKGQRCDSPPPPTSPALSWAGMALSSCHKCTPHGEGECSRTAHAGGGGGWVGNKTQIWCVYVYRCMAGEEGGALRWARCRGVLTRWRSPTKPTKRITAYV